MIGKPEWFKRRKWGGWGVMPATWQGWIYFALIVTILFIVQYLPVSENGKMITIGVFALIILADTIDIMIRMKKDERETIHEAIAERNALWTIIFILAGGVAYQTAKSAILQEFSVDPVILIAIFGGLIAKIISNYYLDKKD